MRHAPHGPLAQLGVGDAPGHDGDTLASQQLGVRLLLGPVGEAEDDHLGAAPPRFFRQVRPDEAGAAGDQQLHPSRSLSAATIRSLAWPSP